MIRLPKKFATVAPQFVLMAVLGAGLGYVITSGRAASLVGDINGDGVVNVFDLSIMLSDWGSSNAAADLNADGVVSILDLSTLLTHWGQTGAGLTPTPTPSGSGVPQATCTNPVFTSSDPQGTWNSGQFPVYNNVWNSTEAGPQTINVCNSGSWYVDSNQPNLFSDPGSVKSYPSVGEFFPETPLSSFNNITSTFGESIPALGEWDASYDIWTNSWSNEIMIQNQTHEHPEDLPYPVGSIPVTIDGTAYHALNVGTGFIVLINDNYVPSGTINLTHVFLWLESKGWVQSTDTLTSIGYGVEISVTESSPGTQGPERFDLTNFSLTAN